MARKTIPTKTESTCDVGANGFDLRSTLVAIASDPDSPPTARVSACRLLHDLDVEAENRRAMVDAGLD